MNNIFQSFIIISATIAVAETLKSTHRHAVSLSKRISNCHMTATRKEEVVPNKVLPAKDSRSFSYNRVSISLGAFGLSALVAVTLQSFELMNNPTLVCNIEILAAAGIFQINLAVDKIENDIKMSEVESRKKEPRKVDILRMEKSWKENIISNLDGNSIKCYHDQK